MRKLLSTILLPILSIAAQGQLLGDFQKQKFTHKGDVLLYRVQYPLNNVPSKKYPLVVVLHGSGEKGNDNEAQLKWGGDLFANPANREKFPAIVVFPQCPSNESWGRVGGRKGGDSSNRFTFLSNEPVGKPLTLVLELIDSLVASGVVDRKRIYIGGLSMGGFGTFEALWRRPKLFAAAFPICGGGDTSKVDAYAKKFPIRVFHGSNDPAVGVNYSRSMVAALQKAGAKVQYTEYPGIGHDSWKNAFAEPDFLSWLFTQKK
ncbi:prolyl oligopeptidase family serine peptidase [Pinibacter soli]|uniref:Prolyl oligopeptidase family serine peptidase n=1 Tax=Pinibacter soli TaxID=3044211 RepID=A0ABT6RCS4_9BACT|nr:prolyl oligopeptidase family serine peptidase [Pinibacter soli]MDI3320377.1 prolyl oligopeptidase family serine peptidase [Pinibacter soli]